MVSMNKNFLMIVYLVPLFVKHVLDQINVKNVPYLSSLNLLLANGSLNSLTK